MNNSNAMTVQDVADFFGIKKEEAHKLITQEKVGVKYMWSPVGIIVSRKQFEDIWGKPQKEEKKGAAAETLSVPSEGGTPSDIAKAMIYRNAMTMLQYSESGKNAAYVREAVKFLEMLTDAPQADVPLIEIQSMSPQPDVQPPKAEPAKKYTPSDVLSEDDKKKILEYIKDKEPVVAKDVFINALGGKEEEYGKNHPMARPICSLLKEQGYSSIHALVTINGKKSQQVAWIKQ